MSRSKRRRTVTLTAGDVQAILADPNVLSSGHGSNRSKRNNEEGFELSSSDDSMHDDESVDDSVSEISEEEEEVHEEKEAHMNGASRNKQGTKGSNSSARTKKRKGRRRKSLPPDLMESINRARLLLDSANGNRLVRASTAEFLAHVQQHAQRGGAMVTVNARSTSVPVAASDGETNTNKVSSSSRPRRSFYARVLPSVAEADARIQAAAAGAATATPGPGTSSSRKRRAQPLTRRHSYSAVVQSKGLDGDDEKENIHQRINMNGKSVSDVATLSSVSSSSKGIAVARSQAQRSLRFDDASPSPSPAPGASADVIVISDDDDDDDGDQFQLPSSTPPPSSSIFRRSLPQQDHHMHVTTLKHGRKRSSAAHHNTTVQLDSATNASLQSQRRATASHPSHDSHNESHSAATAAPTPLTSATKRTRIQHTPRVPRSMLRNLISPRVRFAQTTATSTDTGTDSITNLQQDDDHRTISLQPLPPPLDHPFLQRMSYYHRLPTWLRAICRMDVVHASPNYQRWIPTLKLAADHLESQSTNDSSTPLSSTLSSSPFTTTTRPKNSGRGLERYTMFLLKSRGYERVTLTAGPNDGGIDVVAARREQEDVSGLHGERMDGSQDVWHQAIVQCKEYYKQPSPSTSSTSNPGSGDTVAPTYVTCEAVRAFHSLATSLHIYNRQQEATRKDQGMPGSIPISSSSSSAWISSSSPSSSLLSSPPFSSTDKTSHPDLIADARCLHEAFFITTGDFPNEARQFIKKFNESQRRKTQASTTNHQHQHQLQQQHHEQQEEDDEDRHAFKGCIELIDARRLRQWVDEIEPLDTNTESVAAVNNDTSQLSNSSFPLQIQEVEHAIELVSGMRRRLLGWYYMQLHPSARELDPAQLTRRMQQFLMDAPWPLQVDDEDNDDENGNDNGNEAGETTNDRHLNGIPVMPDIDGAGAERPADMASETNPGQKSLDVRQPFAPSCVARIQHT